MLLDHPSDGLAAIRTHIGAIFVSLELSRKNWLVTSLSPGKGEKMSRHSVTAGDVAGLLALFAELGRKAEARTGQSYPIITIQEAGLDGFWPPRSAAELEHVVDPASIAVPHGESAQTDKIGGETLARRSAYKRGEPRVCDGGGALARGGRPAQALPRTAALIAEHRHVNRIRGFVRAGDIRLQTAAARPAGTA
jgi:transposase